ncbi:MAG: Uma2 family endonuclease [Vicinamibacterales bacterium]
MRIGPCTVADAAGASTRRQRFATTFAGTSRVASPSARIGFTGLKAHPGAGTRLTAPTDVVLSRHDVIEPDLLFVAADQTGVVTDATLQGAPALVVEVLSPSTRKHDAQTKRQLFARSGVREYWLVDPELDAVQVYRRQDDGTFVRVAELSAEDDHALTTPLLPGWSLGLRELFREGM